MCLVSARRAHAAARAALAAAAAAEKRASEAGAKPALARYARAAARALSDAATRAEGASDDTLELGRCHAVRVAALGRSGAGKSGTLNALVRALASQEAFEALGVHGGAGEAAVGIDFMCKEFVGAKAPGAAWEVLPEGDLFDTTCVASEVMLGDRLRVSWQYEDGARFVHEPSASAVGVDEEAHVNGGKAAGGQRRRARLLSEAVGEAAFALSAVASGGGSFRGRISEELAWVKVEIPVAPEHRGVVLVDAPGVGDDMHGSGGTAGGARRREQLERALRGADAALVVTDARPLPGAVERTLRDSGLLVRLVERGAGGLATVVPGDKIWPKHRAKDAAWIAARRAELNSARRAEFAAMMAADAADREEGEGPGTSRGAPPVASLVVFPRWAAPEAARLSYDDSGLPDLAAFLFECRERKLATAVARKELLSVALRDTEAELAAASALLEAGSDAEPSPLPTLPDMHLASMLEDAKVCAGADADTSAIAACRILDDCTPSRASDLTDARVAEAFQCLEERFKRVSAAVVDDEDAALENELDKALSALWRPPLTDPFGRMEIDDTDAAPSALACALARRAVEYRVARETRAICCARAAGLPGLIAHMGAAAGSNDVYRIALTLLGPRLTAAALCCCEPWEAVVYADAARAVAAELPLSERLAAATCFQPAAAELALMCDCFRAASGDASVPSLAELERRVGAMAAPSIAWRTLREGDRQAGDGAIADEGTDDLCTQQWSLSEISDHIHAAAAEGTGWMAVEPTALRAQLEAFWGNTDDGFGWAAATYAACRDED